MLHYLCRYYSIDCSKKNFWKNDKTLDNLDLVNQNNLKAIGGRENCYGIENVGGLGIGLGIGIDGCVRLVLYFAIGGHSTGGGEFFF